MQKQARACPAKAELRVCDYRAPDFKMVGAKDYRSEFATQRKRQRRRDKQGESCAIFNGVYGLTVMTQGCGSWNVSSILTRLPFYYRV